MAERIYTGTDDPTNTQIGSEGNSVLPGEMAHEHLRLGEDKRFNHFPRRNLPGGGYQFDQKAIRKEYLDSPIVEWSAFCASKGYNPRVYAFPFKAWVREKKYRNVWEGFRTKIEEEGKDLGARTLLQQVRAVKRVPETLANMLTLLQNIMDVHALEMQADAQNMGLMKKAIADGAPTDHIQFKFSLTPGNAVLLSAALKHTTEGLFKSLGIDEAMSLSPKRWVELIEDEVGKIDGSKELMEQEEINPIRLSLLGGEDMRKLLAEAHNNWMDKPGQDAALHPEPKPDTMQTPAEDTPEIVSEDNE